MSGIFIIMMIMSVISVAIVIKNIRVGLYTFISLILILTVFTMGALAYSESEKLDKELIEKEKMEIHSFQDVGEHAYYRDKERKNLKSNMVHKEDFVVEEAGLNENSSVQVYERKGTSKFINWFFGDVSYGEYYVFKLSEDDKIKAES